VRRVRKTTCRKSERPADVAPLLPAGPRGLRGDDGARGPARGWVHVDNAANIVSTSHFAAVQRVATGVYCLEPDGTIDATASLGLATPEYGYSAGSSLLAYVHVPASSCPAGTFQVDTVDLQGMPSSDVAFLFVVI